MARYLTTKPLQGERRLVAMNALANHPLVVNARDETARDLIQTADFLRAPRGAGQCADLPGRRRSLAVPCRRPGR